MVFILLLKTFRWVLLASIHHVNFERRGRARGRRRFNQCIFYCVRYLAEPFSWFTQALLDAEINDVITAQNHSMNIDMKLHKLVLDSANASKNGRTAIPIISSCI